MRRLPVLTSTVTDMPGESARPNASAVKSPGDKHAGLTKLPKTLSVNDSYTGSDLPNASLRLARLSQLDFIGSSELGAWRIVDHSSLDLAAIAFEAGIASLENRKHLFMDDLNLSMFAAVQNL